MINPSIPICGGPCVSQSGSWRLGTGISQVDKSLPPSASGLGGWGTPGDIRGGEEGDSGGGEEGDANMVGFQVLVVVKVL